MDTTHAVGVPPLVAFPLPAALVASVMDNPNLSTGRRRLARRRVHACDTIVPASSSVVVTAAARLDRILLLARVLVLERVDVDVDVDDGNDAAVIALRTFPPLVPLPAPVLVHARAGTRPTTTRRPGDARVRPTASDRPRPTDRDARPTDRDPRGVGGAGWDTPDSDGIRVPQGRGCASSANRHRHSSFVRSFGRSVDRSVDRSGGRATRSG